MVFAFSAISQTFTSATDPGSAPRSEGLVFNASNNGSGSIGTRGWTGNTGAPMLGSPKLADLTGDGVDEIVLTTYGISNPYGEGWLYAWDGATGAELPNYPVQLVGAPPGTPAIGDLDGDGDVEIVQGTWNYLYVFNADGTSVPGWPKAMYITQAAALSDLDNNGDLEIIVPSSMTMKVYNHDGSLFPTSPMTGTNDLTAPAVGDLDGDGDMEILAGSFKASGSASDHVYAWHHDGTAVTGFPTDTAGSVKAAPALADLDRDGQMEVVADCWNKSGTDFLYVWDSAGNDMPGWPINAAYIRLSSPSVADLDLDGELEIVVGGWSTNPYGEKVYAYHHDATAVSGFPVVLSNSPSGNVNCTLTTGDIDGDGHVEIVIKATNNNFALNHDGSVAAGFPVFLDDESHSGTTSPTPALGDPDGDGLLEIFAAACFDNVALIDQNGVCSPDALCWPTYRLDPFNRGAHSFHTLSTNTHTLSESTGGVIDFELDAGPDKANRYYLLLGGVTGTSPGWELPGGNATLPINWDVFTGLILKLANTAVFPNFMGQLDSEGKSSAQMNTGGPLIPGYVGVRIYFAYLLNKPWEFVSNHVMIMVAP